MDKINTVLEFLDNAGVGNPQKINGILENLYGQPDYFDNENEYFEYTRRIINFLNELRDANLIKYRIEGFFGNKIAGKYSLLSDCNIIASITYQGTKSLKRGDASQVTYNTTFNGSFSGNLNQGDGNPEQIFTETKKLEKPKWLTLNFYWEELIKYWYKLILAVIGVFLLSWLGLHFFKNKSSNTQPSPSQSGKADSIYKQDTLQHSKLNKEPKK